ncbi:MAG TPA: Tim44-like domain-containing protein [Burkholderiales bacterium]|nr:Tim44-like domain-containing protein [Burkholderiales bacterium]
MNKLLGFVLAGLLGLGIAVPDADAARRLGGGSSLGKQREMQPVEPRRAPDAPAAAPAPKPQPAPAAAPAPAPGGSRWLGPLAGLAAGGLLGALLFGGAFEGIKFMDVLVIVALAAGVYFLLRALRRPQPQAAQYAGLGASGPVPIAEGGAAVPETDVARVPPGFDSAGFLRSARLSFTRLQAANDRKDLADIRDFTTPEMFEAIARQLAERGDTPQRSEVQALDAALLEVSNEGDAAWASVRFTGSMRDAASGEAEAFDEVWHVAKDLRDPKSVWLIAGIQQVA